MWIEGLSYFGIYRLWTMWLSCAGLYGDVCISESDSGRSSQHSADYDAVCEVFHFAVFSPVLGILYHSGMGADIRVCQRNDALSEMVLDFLSADWNGDCENAQYLWQSCLGQCH